MLECLNGLVVLREESATVYPTADEIYSVVHEGATAIRGHYVSTKEFKDLGILFNTAAGEPVLDLSLSPGVLQTPVQAKLYVKDGDAHLPVPSADGQLLDYGCNGRMWVPLLPGTTDAIERMYGALGGERLLSMRQYLEFTALKERVVSVADHVPELMRQGLGFAAPTFSIPKAFHGKLYPYQDAGFRWLAFMAGQGVPGCLLADEMGLGKTVQIICAYLAVCESGLDAACLIVCPATLLENWRREFGKFAPTVLPLIHRGANRTGLGSVLASQEVVITSYETMLSDISLFRSVKWGLLVLDEAQAIKNPEARRTRGVKSLSRHSAIAVTGTPVENRLTDLWSISDFLLPGRLGSLQEFQSHHPENYDGAIALEPRVSPFILRRRVSDVARDLPSRIDIPQATELDDDSIANYDKIRSAVNPEERGSALATLQRLRMFCAHPWLIDEFRTGDDPASCSPKLVRTGEIIEELYGWNQKVLIFTSFLEMSDILLRFLGRRFSAPAWQIDGRVAVPDRQGIVDIFSETKGAAALILNPRAAGTGLNIVAANHVIHYNLEWNPAVEDQASARAYRRGQMQPVTVHRLYYSGTLEELIANRAESKRELAAHSVTGSDGTDIDPASIIEALAMSPSRTT
jgi:SNF2 family DNA or RNA helicase